MFSFLKQRKAEFQSGMYWRDRYAVGGTSGSGSTGRLAAHKAEFINRLVDERKIRSVIEFGSGDGSQAELFRFSNYTGVDVVEQVVEAARRRFADRDGWAFRTLQDYDACPTRHDVAISLDVIYHLVEDEVYEAYMRRLVQAAENYILIYASDHDERPNARHVRHRSYSEWMGMNAPGWGGAGSWDHPYPFDPADPETTSFAFFRLYERRPSDRT